MTKEHIQQYFPDTARMFVETSNEHPFWRAIRDVDLDDAKAGRTLLNDLEQMFAWLVSVDGHHVAREHLESVGSHRELMEVLTSYYMAYLYRDHNPRVVTMNDEHGYDVEIELADQLVALGIVQFQNFESPEIQFAPQIEDEMQHLDAITDGGSHSQQFIEHLQHHADSLKDHPRAQHQVMAAITHSTQLDTQQQLYDAIRNAGEDMRKKFPNIAGVVLVDSVPGTEHAKFIPFHDDNNELERLFDTRTH